MRRSAYVWLFSSRSKARCCLASEVVTTSKAGTSRPESCGDSMACGRKFLSFPILFSVSYRYRVVMKKSSLKFSIMITAVAPAAMLAGMWLTATYRGNDSRAMLLPDRVMTLFPDAKPLTAFALTDHQNRVFDLSRLKSKWSFLFFGFTHCPDICPTTLADWPAHVTKLPSKQPVLKISNSSLSQWIRIAIPSASSSNTWAIFIRPLLV